MTRRTAARRLGLGLGAAAALALFAVRGSSQTSCDWPNWCVGDVFAGIGDGTYQVYDNQGNLKGAVTTGIPFDITTGCAVARSTGHLYTTNLGNSFAGTPDFDPDFASKVTIFDGAAPHGVLQVIDTEENEGTAVESVAFDNLGFLYFGHAGFIDTPTAPNFGIQKFSTYNGGVASFQQRFDVVGLENPGFGGFFNGSDWIDVAADQQRIVYASESSLIRVLDTSTGLSSNWGDVGGQAFALRLLPPGNGLDLLVATPANIRWFRKASPTAPLQLLKTYNDPAVADAFWFAVNVDPDGRTFWSADLRNGRLYRFDIATGNIVRGPIQTPALPFELAGVCIKMEYTAAFGLCDADDDGEPDDPCPPLQPAIPERCNDGIDNDRDGLVDEICTRQNREGDHVWPADYPALVAPDAPAARTYTITGLPRDLVANLTNGVITSPNGGSGRIGFDQAGEYLVRIEARNGNGVVVASGEFTWRIRNNPHVVDDEYSVDEDMLLSVAAPGVMANDTIDGTPSVFLSASPTNGTLTFNADGSFTYQPNPDFFGVDSFSYRGTDGVLNSSHAHVRLNVLAVNDPPFFTAGGDITVDEDAGPQTFTGWATGISPGAANEASQILTFQVTTDSAALFSAGPAINAAGTLTFTPAADAHGSAQVTVVLRDNGGTARGGRDRSDPVTFTILVRSVPDDPIARDDAYSVLEDGLLTVPAPGVLGNDRHPDGDTLTPSLLTGVAHGTLEFNVNGSFTYKPAPDYHGPDSFTYEVRDSQGRTAMATVRITVLPVNDPPKVFPHFYTTDEDVPLVVPAPGLLDDAVDVDGDRLTAHLMVPPSNGTVVVNPDGSFTYTPKPDFFGVDLFTFGANDGFVNSNTEFVRITVRAVNDPPVARDDSYSTDEDTVLSVPAPGVLANDTDVDSPVLTAVLESGPAHGTLVLNGNGSFDYTPHPNFFGADSFAYRASDGSLRSQVATVRITVRQVNDAPVANDDAYNVIEGGVLNVASPGVLANDVDVDGDPLTAVLVSPPAHGQLVFNANGSFTYTPEENFFGTDTFYYRASDGSLQSNIARVTIEVGPVNDAPVADDDAYTTDEDTVLNVPAPGVLGNDTDIENDPLRAVLVTGPTHGQLVLRADGSFTYAPAPNFNGSDAFTYQANDGAANSNVATVRITVAPVNDDPFAVDDAAETNKNTPVVIDVLANDSDPDGDPLTVSEVSAVTPADGGTVAINLGESVTYTPGVDFSGFATFDYWASDGKGGTGRASVVVFVRPNTDPVCVAAAASPAELWPPNHRVVSPVSIVGAIDPDGDALAVTITRIYQDEPTNTIGDGNTAIDGFGIGTSQALVRAERTGAKKKIPFSGRVYHISFLADDGNGGSCAGVVKVCVPHDQGRGRVCVDDGPLYDSTVAFPPVSGDPKKNRDKYGDKAEKYLDKAEDALNKAEQTDNEKKAEKYEEKAEKYEDKAVKYLDKAQRPHKVGEPEKDKDKDKKDKDKKDKDKKDKGKDKDDDKDDDKDQASKSDKYLDKAEKYLDKAGQATDEDKAQKYLDKAQKYEDKAQGAAAAKPKDAKPKDDKARGNTKDKKE